jgi:hypothetical protein
LKVSVVIADIDEKGGRDAADAAGNGAVFSSRIYATTRK